MEIKEKYIDTAGKIRVIFQIDDVRAIMLKFEKDISDEEIKNMVQSILDQEQIEIDGNEG